MGSFNLFFAACAAPLLLLVNWRFFTPLSGMIERINESLQPDREQRHDYASIESGARVLHTSNSISGAKNLLLDNKDKYMLVACKSLEKWVELSLNEDIHLEGFTFVHREIYSSYFKEVTVYASTEYPPSVWAPVGRYKLNKDQEKQVFKVTPRWVRFIRLEFLSHYDSEHYCTLTQFSVFGTNVIHAVNKNYLERQESVKETISKISRSEIILSPTEAADSSQAVKLLESLSRTKNSPAIQEQQFSSFDPTNFLQYLEKIAIGNTTAALRARLTNEEPSKDELAFKLMVDKIGSAEIQLNLIEKLIKTLSSVIQQSEQDIKLLKETVASNANNTLLRDHEIDYELYSLETKFRLLETHTHNIELEQHEKDSNIERLSSFMVLIFLVEVAGGVLLGVVFCTDRTEEVRPSLPVKEEVKHYPRLIRSASLSSLASLDHVRGFSSQYNQEDLLPNSPAPL